MLVLASQEYVCYNVPNQMTPSLPSLCRASLRLFVFFAAAAHAVAAQNAPARLRLQVDSRGQVAIYLVVFLLPPQPAVLETYVADALGLKLRDVDWDIDMGKKVVSMYASSAGALPHDLLTVHGEIALPELERKLAELHASVLELQLSHPRSGFTTCKPGERMSPPSNPTTDYRLNLPLNGGLSPPVLFGFGYRRADLSYAFGWMAGMIIVTFGSACLAKRLLASGQPSQTQSSTKTRFLIGYPVACALFWLAVLGLFRLDVLAFYLANAESSSEQTMTAFALLFLPVSGAAWICAKVLHEPSGTTQRPGAGSGEMALAIRTQLTLLLPALLAASALVAHRSANLSQASLWAIAAAAVAIVAFALFLWENAEALGISRPAMEHGGDGWRDLRRRAKVRSCYARIGPLLFLPLLAVVIVREQHVEGMTRYLVFAGALVLSMVMLATLEKVLPRLKQRDERKMAAVQGEPSLDAIAVERQPRPTRLGVILSSLVWLAVVGAMAFVACYLFRFSFDLTQGDDGWAMMLLALAAVLIDRMLISKSLAGA
jgi:hypothetical protein